MVFSAEIRLGLGGTVLYLHQSGRAPMLQASLLHIPSIIFLDFNAMIVSSISLSKIKNITIQKVPTPKSNKCSIAVIIAVRLGSIGQRFRQSIV